MGEWEHESTLSCQLASAREVLWQLQGPSEGLIEQLARHRALLFRWDRSWSLNHPTDENETTTFFGNPMSYREYWELFPEEKPTPDWETWALLALDGPFADFRLRALLADPWPDFHIVAVRIGGEDGDSSFLPAHVRPKGGGWDFGEGLQLEPTAPPPGRMRDWKWGWNPTCGPCRFGILSERTAAELNAWLDSTERRCYEPLAEVLIPGAIQGVLREVYHPREGGDRQLDNCERPNGLLRVSEGEIRMWRSYGSTNSWQQSAECSVLAAILAGGLGEVQWDLLDEDWYRYDAQGPDLASLRDYLDPDLDEGELRARWNICKATVDCRDCPGWDEVRQAVAAQFGCKGVADLFVGLRAGEYPREILVELGPHLSCQQGAQEVVPRALHIAWTFRQAAGNDTAPSVSATWVA